MSEWNAKVIKEFRENDGLIGGPFEGMTLLLLHTTGAKTGKERINPLATMKEKGGYIIIASKGGAASHPDWFHNLVANPEVTVEVGTETFEAHAQVTDEPERTELYAKMADKYSGFKAYEEKTERVIPVIKLKRLS